MEEEAALLSASESRARVVKTDVASHFAEPGPHRGPGKSWITTEARGRYSTAALVPNSALVVSVSVYDRAISAEITGTATNLVLQEQAATPVLSDPKPQSVPVRSNQKTRSDEAIPNAPPTPN